MKLERYAAIDIGSNGVRLLINNVYETQGKPVFDKTILVRAPVRLGTDSFGKHIIQPRSIEMLSEAMKSFYSLMRVYEVKMYRACATSALREAENHQDVISAVFQASRIKIDIINGSEEAEIVYKTQVIDYVKDNKGYLYIDVGGGSTELTYYHQTSAKASKSFKIGSIRLMNHLVEDSEWNDMEDFISSLNINRESVAVGTGGNINTIFKRSQHSLGSSLSLDYLVHELKTIEPMTIDQRIIEYKFNPDRADVVVPALKIYCRVMKMATIEEIFVPKIGLADGIIQSIYQNQNANTLEQIN